MHFFSPHEGKEVVRWCDHCDIVFPCGNCCYEGGCGYDGCAPDGKDPDKECWCIDSFDHPVNNCPIHGKEYFYDDRERVEKIFRKRWLEKQESKKK